MGKQKVATLKGAAKVKHSGSPLLPGTGSIFGRICNNDDLVKKVVVASPKSAGRDPKTRFEIGEVASTIRPVEINVFSNHGKQLWTVQPQQPVVDEKDPQKAERALREAECKLMKELEEFLREEVRRVKN
ncbi:hypothetical protein HYX70_03085 [Candidatus Saccharibacteria bacterium]|nr:hypothetical protein [Candidatus Saccharibacteria bacterium]